MSDADPVAGASPSLNDHAAYLRAVSVHDPTAGPFTSFHEWQRKLAVYKRMEEEAERERRQAIEDTFDEVVVKHVRRAERQGAIAHGLRFVRATRPRTGTRQRAVRSVTRRRARAAARSPGREPEPEPSRAVSHWGTA